MHYPLVTPYDVFLLPSHQTTKSPPTPSNRSTSARLIRNVKLQYCIFTVIRNYATLRHVLVAIQPIALPFARFLPLRVSAFSSVSSFCSGGSSDPGLSPTNAFFSKPFRIRTSEKCPPNSFRIRTHKTQDLKPFRICTYKKNGVILRGVVDLRCRAGRSRQPSFSVPRMLHEWEVSV
jgi:hypothetical protein